MILVPLSGCERAQISICILLYAVVIFVNTIMENKMTLVKKIKSWGLRYAPSFVRRGSHRRIAIMETTRFRNDTVDPEANVFIAYTKSGYLNIQVNISGEKNWTSIYNRDLGGE